MKNILISLCMLSLLRCGSEDISAERPIPLTPKQKCQVFASELGESNALCSCPKPSPYCAVKLEKWLLWMHCGRKYCDIRMISGSGISN